jgi:alkanesulfonate monooxygenase SsuD/methylene tetrahydromethanopterin reductase-like flavin-dependent oxidoreductase (luciferase family)
MLCWREARKAADFGIHCGASNPHKGENMDRERLGLAVVPVAAVGWSAEDIQNAAREAEAAGFEAIFTTEVNNDAMATAQLMGSATERINVGTWVANVYLRHPYVCAQGAALIAASTGGRFILGLGVSHQPVNGALKIDMSNAGEYVRRYTADVQAGLRGEGPATHLPQMPAPRKVPVMLRPSRHAWSNRRPRSPMALCRSSGRRTECARVRPG